MSIKIKKKFIFIKKLDNNNQEEISNLNYDEQLLKYRRIINILRVNNPMLSKDEALIAIKNDEDLNVTYSIKEFNINENGHSEDS